MNKKMERHKHFMDEAIREGEKNLVSAHGGPFGAVIVRNNEIVGRSGNNVLKRNDPTAHAEVEAIRLAANHLGSYDLSDCVIYTSCEPCPMCLGAIFWARIHTIYYAADRHDAAAAGFDDSKFYRMIGQPASEREIQSIRIMQKEGASLFKKWLEIPHKKIY
jgi:guanine deaminase